MSGSRKRRYRLYNNFLIALLIASCLPAQAELYKWVDEKGNTHYSDSKPGDLANDTLASTPSTSKAEVRDKNGTFFTAVNTPIKNSGTDSRTVRLAGVNFELHPDMHGSYLGVVRGGKLCKSVQDNITLRQGNRPGLANSLRIQFSQLASRLGYRLFEGEDDMSWLAFIKDGPKPDYRLFATFELIQANGCNKKYIAVYKTTLSTYYQVRWTLVDTKSGNVAYEGTSAGYNNGLYYTKELKTKGFVDSTEKSLRYVVENLFAQPLFVSKLVK